MIVCAPLWLQIINTAVLGTAVLFVCGCIVYTTLKRR